VRLTCIAPYVPFEGIDHAGGAYFHQFLESLAREHDVRLIAPDLAVNRPTSTRRNPAHLDVHRVSLTPLSRSKFVRALVYPLDLLNGVTLGTLILRAVRNDRAAQDLVASSDVVEIHWSRCLPLVPWARRIAPNAVITAWEYDVMYQSLERRARHASSARLAFESRATRRIVRRREPRLLNQSDAVFVFSDKDRDILAGLGVRVPMHVVDPLVSFPDDPPGPSAEPVALFVGAMDRAENADAVRWFLNHVWPTVCIDVPGARLIIAGGNPPADLRSLAMGSVEVTGYVEDLDPYYRAARLVVVPLRMGAGVKFKVPQAMAYRLPVITTSVGAEGIVDRSGDGIFAGILSDPEDWSRLVTTMLRDIDDARAVGERGYRWVHTTLDFEASTRKVVERYRSLARR
jgi:glycosyltransferase involved in cell wall biosynthesis